MKIEKVRTHKIAPGEILLEIINNYVSEITENSILVITSKIMSICQNRVVDKNKVKSKADLIISQADAYLDGKYMQKYGVWLTIKNNILIPSAGIDESNANGNYILYPENIQKELEHLWQALRIKHNIKNFGILLTDSHTTPLRRGVTGIALGWCGFQALYNYIGAPDIYGTALKMTQLNIIDSLAAAAVLTMGEGNEQTPLAVITDCEKTTFQDLPPTKEELLAVTISIEDDIYAPLLNTSHWITKEDIYSE